MYINKYFTGIALLIFILAYTGCGKNDDTSKTNNNNNEIIIPDCGTLTDIDGNTYQTVVIGNLCWMRENLKTTKFNDGTSLSEITDDEDWLEAVSSYDTPAYCWYNNDFNNYGKIYGALYNLTAIRNDKLCPQGWHVPDNEDWYAMFQTLAAQGHSYPPSETPFKVAKALADNTRWQKSKALGAVGNDLSANNKSGFSALPGGYRNADGAFFQEGKSTRFWANQHGSISSWIVAFNEKSPFYNITHSAYVRCVKSN